MFIRLKLSRYYRFVVLRGSYLVYYNSKAEFEARPNNPVNKRPINFDKYTVDIEVTETFYRILLTPGRGINKHLQFKNLVIDSFYTHYRAGTDDDEISQLKSWEFRCDTPAELESWRDAFQYAATCSQHSHAAMLQQQQQQQYRGKAGGSVISAMR
jgi:hypothetical protein